MINLAAKAHNLLGVDSVGVDVVRADAVRADLVGGHLERVE